MEVKHLSDDEVLVELEVNKLLEGSDRTVNEERRRILQEVWQENRESGYIPSVPHEGALKNPQREAELLLKKLKSIQVVLTSPEFLTKPIHEVIPSVLTKISHLKNRFSRMSKSPTFGTLTGNLLKGCEALYELIYKIRFGKITPAGASEAAAKLILGITKHRVTRETRRPDLSVEWDSEEDTRADENLYKEEPKPHCSRDTQYFGGDKFLEKVDHLILDDEEEDDLDWKSPSQAHGRKEVGKKSTPSMEHHNTKSNWDQRKLRQVVKTWKVSFAGTSSQQTIEVFLARIERHAWRAQILLIT